MGEYRRFLGCSNRPAATHGTLRNASGDGGIRWPHASALRDSTLLESSLAESIDTRTYAMEGEPLRQQSKRRPLAKATLISEGR